MKRVLSLLLFLCQAMGAHSICYSGYYLDGKDCTPCPGGTYMPEELHTESKCFPWSKKPDGYHWIVKVKGNITQNQVWGCENGYVEQPLSDLNSQYRCRRCSNGTYMPEELHTESKCIPWSKKPNGYHWIVKVKGNITQDQVWGCENGYIERSNLNSQNCCYPLTTNSSTLPSSTTTVTTLTSTLLSAITATTFTNITPGRQTYSQTTAATTPQIKTVSNREPDSPGLAIGIGIGIGIGGIGTIIGIGIIIMIKMRNNYLYIGIALGIVIGSFIYLVIGLVIDNDSVIGCSIGIIIIIGIISSIFFIIIIVVIRKYVKRQSNPTPKGITGNDPETDTDLELKALLLKDGEGNRRDTVDTGRESGENSAHTTVNVDVENVKKNEGQSSLATGRETSNEANQCDTKNTDSKAQEAENDENSANDTENVVVENVNKNDERETYNQAKQCDTKKTNRKVEPLDGNHDGDHFIDSMQGIDIGSNVKHRSHDSSVVKTNFEDDKTLNTEQK